MGGKCVLVSPLQEAQPGALATRHLFISALLGKFVGPKPQEARPVAKSAASEVIVFDFDDKGIPHWLPFGRAFGAPATWPARSVTGESSATPQRQEQFRQPFPFDSGKARSEPHMVEQPF